MSEVCVDGVLCELANLIHIEKLNAVRWPLQHNVIHIDYNTVSLQDTRVLSRHADMHCNTMSSACALTLLLC